MPTFGYDLAQAVKDGYLVDYVSIEQSSNLWKKMLYTMNFLKKIKKCMSLLLEKISEQMPDTISSSRLNSWVFNEDTISRYAYVDE